MKIHIASRVALAVVVAICVLVMFGFYSIVTTLDSLEQPVLIEREGVVTRTVPVARTILKPGTVIRESDIEMVPWPVSELRGNVLQSDEPVIGRVVKNEIKASMPVPADALEERDE